MNNHSKMVFKKEHLGQKNHSDCESFETSLSWLNAKYAALGGALSNVTSDDVILADCCGYKQQNSCLKSKVSLHANKKINKQLPELNISRKIIWLCGGIFHLNAMFSFHQHTCQTKGQKHGASSAQSYSRRIVWCCRFSLPFSSSSLQLSDIRSILHLRVCAIIPRFSSKGSGAGWSSTEPKCTCRTEGQRDEKRKGVNERVRPNEWKCINRVKVKSIFHAGLYFRNKLRNMWKPQRIIIYWQVQYTSDEKSR